MVAVAIAFSNSGDEQATPEAADSEVAGEAESEGELACPQAQALADEELAAMEGTEVLDDGVWERYVGVVLGNPDCFSEEIVSGVAHADSQMSEIDNQSQDRSSPRIRSSLIRCIIDSNDGTIRGIIEVSNLGSESVSVEGSLLVHYEGIRVGNGTSYTTLRPNETARLSIIGGASQWPRYVGDPGYECTHEARASS